ncbi:hypothetical protein BZA05DRAFT_390661 [Tricharina praecox]|uniref:uncharacterized protein n=1 Tax=Tricharina praecox TaxID=43433 RepID=UPI002220CDC6|nr:uncharacterized protein BZA05DRAFT_390661 [Tricharina praecox]KAI5856110.1 hypothetical protein BZA05DRAFT_390661 [Tricharina praecox]
MSVLSTICRGFAASKTRLAGITSGNGRLIGGTTGGTILKAVALRGVYNFPHHQEPIRRFSAASVFCEEVKESALEYDRIARSTLESLSEALDGLAEAQEGYDLEYSAGVMSFSSPKGVFVINKQPPNRQIWLSSPVSGPLQFRYDRGINAWVDIRGSGKTLASVMKEELGIQFEVYA